MGSARLPARAVAFDEDDTTNIGCFAGVARRLGSGALEAVEFSGDRSARRRGSLEFRTCRLCQAKGHLTRDCPQKVKSADKKAPSGKPPDWSSVRQKLRTGSGHSILSVPQEVDTMEVSSRADGGKGELTVRVDRKPCPLSPCTPLRSPLLVSPQMSSPIMASSLSGSSNRESPYSTSSVSRFNDAMSPFSTPCKFDGSLCKAEEYSPTVELPLDSEPSSLNATSAGDEKNHRPIERWRSLSLTEFDRLDAACSLSSQMLAMPEPQLSLDRDTADGSEMSDFDKYGIDIDLFVGSTRLPPSSLIGQSGDLQSSTRFSPSAFSPHSWSSASAFSRQTTTVTDRDEMESAESNKWQGPVGVLPGRDLSMSTCSFGREDSFGPSDRFSLPRSEGASWRLVEDVGNLGEAAEGAGKHNCTDGEGKVEASLIRCASEQSKRIGSGNFRSRSLSMGGFPPYLREEDGSVLFSQRDPSLPRCPLPEARDLEDDSDGAKAESKADVAAAGKRRSKRAVVMNSLKKWLS